MGKKAWKRMQKDIYQENLKQSYLAAQKLVQQQQVQAKPIVVKSFNELRDIERLRALSNAKPLGANHQPNQLNQSFKDTKPSVKQSIKSSLNAPISQAVSSALNVAKTTLKIVNPDSSKNSQKDHQNGHKIEQKKFEMHREPVNHRPTHEKIGHALEKAKVVNSPIRKDERSSKLSVLLAVVGVTMLAVAFVGKSYLSSTAESAKPTSSISVGREVTEIKPVLNHSEERETSYFNAKSSSGSSLGREKASERIVALSPKLSKDEKKTLKNEKMASHKSHRKYVTATKPLKKEKLNKKSKSKKIKKSLKKISSIGKRKK